jgi:hypothetical protein
MAGPQPPVTMHVQPDALPALRVAFDDALGELNTHLAQLSRGGFIPKAWMGDPISEDVRVFYNTTVMESGEGSLAALLAYQAELTRIRDSVQAMEAQYLGNEDQVAGDMRRQKA